MGAALSWRKRPEKPKRLRQYGKVHEYLLETTRKRPKTSKSTRQAKFIATLGQQGRSATMFEMNKETPVTRTNDPIPRWQSKWEIDMRPDPSKEHENNLVRAWKSMPLPTTEKASASSKASPVNRPSHSRKSRKSSRFRERRGTHGRGSMASMPAIEEPDKFDLLSIASYKVDERKMLHKSDERTQSILDLTASIWNIEPKKHNKTWFLGQDIHPKHLSEPTVSFENMPKHTKPFTSYVNLVKPKLDSHVKKQEAIVPKHETILEEE